MTIGKNDILVRNIACEVAHPLPTKCRIEKVKIKSGYFSTVKNPTVH